MPAPDEEWPTRRGQPLDVLTAHEELCRRLRRRCLDALAAEADGATEGPDASKQIAAYARSLDALTGLQFDLGLLQRVAPLRPGMREAVPSGACAVDQYSAAEQARMQRQWFAAMSQQPADPKNAGDGRSAGDDA